MQIKVEKFLALTAILAAAPLSAGCGDDAATTPAGPQTDSGLSATSTNATGADAAATDTAKDAAPGLSSSATAGESSSAVDSGTVDGGTPDASTSSSDSGGASPSASVADASLTPPDAALLSDASAPWLDAAAGDSSADASPHFDGGWDAGNELLCGPDFADETFFANCSTFDSCYESGVIAADICYGDYYNYRADVTTAFWDCYANAGVSDPCSYDADLAASSCQATASAGACVDNAVECDSVLAGCSVVGLEYCRSTMAPYNSSYRQMIADCASYFSEVNGPDAESCDVVFDNCVASPSLE